MTAPVTPTPFSDWLVAHYAEIADETTREVFLEDQAFTAYQLLAMIEREYAQYPIIVAACRAALWTVINAEPDV